MPRKKRLLANFARSSDISEPQAAPSPASMSSSDLKGHSDSVGSAINSKVNSPGKL